MTKLKKEKEPLLSGKIGNVIAVNHRGVNILRSAPKKISSPPTKNQIRQRQKMALISAFLKPARPVVDFWFGNPEYSNARINEATSYNIREALNETEEGVSINYKRVLLTLGNLIGAYNVTGEKTADNKISLQWIDNSDYGQAKPSDKFLAVFYCKETNEFEFSTDAKRSDSALNFSLPVRWTGKTIHCWISFVAEDNLRWSTGQYIDLD